MSISGEKVLADKIAQFKDIDLTPEEFGLKIQGDRAIYIINRCLAKLNTLVSTLVLIGAYLKLI